MSEIESPFHVYTDGSCWTGDRIGAWAWVGVDPNGTDFGSGGSDVDTTISRMELMGPIDALEFLYELYGPCDVVIHSDSEYVVLGITDRSRKRNKNGDLWDWLDEITDAHESVEYLHVKGHAGNHYNEIADELAGAYRTERQDKERAVTPRSELNPDCLLVLEALESAPNRTLTNVELGALKGGGFAWRSRVSDLRKKYGYPVGAAKYERDGLYSYTLA